MSWWGKIIGGALGFLIGGPLGAMLGAALGQQYDSGVTGDRSRALPGDQERIQAAFFTATFSIMGHLAKSDGRVTKDEIALAEALMAEMQLDADQRKLAKTLFNQGKNPSFSFDEVVGQFRRECHRRRTLLRMFLEVQVQAALADQQLDPRESSVLQLLAARLGFSSNELDQIIAFVRGGFETQAKADSLQVEDAYAILGVNADTPLAEIKKAYRRLLSQHHPDKLVSKGLPEEMIRLANEKTHEIKTAWKTVQHARQGKGA